MIVKDNKVLVFFVLFFINMSFLQIELVAEDSVEVNSEESYIAGLNTEDKEQRMIIKRIYVEGNKYVKSDVILNIIPYKVGDVFDSSKSADAINNLCNLGYFRQVELKGEKLTEGEMNLWVVVEETKLLEKIEFKGNKVLSGSKLRGVINADKLSTLDDLIAQRLIKEMKKAYQEENRHKVQISFELIPNQDNPDKVTAIFYIEEGPKSTVKRVFFVGNREIPERKLRKTVFTREDWLLSFSDGAGVYVEDEIEIDKHRLEYFYRNYGFIQAKVYKTKVDFVHGDREVHVTFYINEGPKYFMREIRAPGDEIYSEDELLPLISLESGKPYSHKKVVESMNRLRDLWGKKGYIYADVYPQIKPDEEKHIVDVTFYVERGNRMYVNQIEITGNRYTRDKVIRRQLSVVEGDLITSRDLQRSKNQVEYLGYFEREGVDWKIHRITDDLADLEMNVKEAKTGHAHFEVSYGSDRITPRPSLRGRVVLEKNNLFGLGYDVGGMLQASRHRLQRLEANLFDPHVFDTDISCAVNPYWRWIEYDLWSGVNKRPMEKVGGFDFKLGFPLTKIDKRLQVIFDFGYENIRNNHPRAYDWRFEPIVNRTFRKGDLTWFGVDFVKDTRNHKIYPNDGYKLILSSKLAPTNINNTFGFFKAELEASFYYALIGKDSLVLAMRALGGRISSLGNRYIPYKELYQMGGQSTVRGFVWGGVGPAWEPTGAPLGARNGVLFSTELIFPIVSDYSMKGHVFYDAGAGWSTPKQDFEIRDITDPRGRGIDLRNYITRDKFDLRHSVGFGLNLVNPFPAKIDWGFKLDRKRHLNESPYEFHLSMNYAW